MSIYFDTHAHLDDERFDDDRENIFSELSQTTTVMNVGCDLDSSRRSVALANQYSFIYAAVGSHPDYADNIGDDVLDVYRALAADPKVKAIGEIGLDYHYEDIPRAQQQVAFRRQLALAQELKLPVIVHMREAAGDALDMIREYPAVTGVFHCFSGSVETAKVLVDRGWYIGFTGVITFKNARRAVEVAEFLPMDRIVVETDCPYMTPEPYRGTRNDSRYIPRMVEKLAQIKGVSLDTMAAVTTENGRRLFGID